jgi:hypothetical protein
MQPVAMCGRFVTTSTLPAGGQVRPVEGKESRRLDTSSTGDGLHQSAGVLFRRIGETPNTHGYPIVGYVG